MDTEYFDELFRRLQRMIEALSTVLSPAERAEVEELLNHAELGEALRTLAWMVVEEGKQIRAAEVREIEAVGARMGIRDELPRDLREHGRDG